MSDHCITAQEWARCEEALMGLTGAGRGRALNESRRSATPGARRTGVDMTEKNWKELGSRPGTGRTKEDREASARKAAETCEEHQHRHK